MSIIPANEALQMQAEKQKEYELNFEKYVAVWENLFNKEIKKCHKDDTYVDVPSTCGDELLRKELLKRIEVAGYYVEYSGYGMYKAYFKHPQPNWLMKLFGAK